jgi:sporulation protein YlmC with PRC-barrel domain
VQPGQIRTSNLMGSKIYDKQGNDIGTIKDIIVDADGKIAAVVLDVGSGKYVAVNMNQIKTSVDKNNKVQYSLDMSKDQVKSLQAYNLNQAPSGSAGTSTPPASSSK